MKWFVLVGVLWAGVAGAQTTKPTTVPSLIDIVPLQKARDATAQAAAREKEAAKDRWEGSAECKRLTAALDEARATLEDARKSGTAQEKLDASRAYNITRLELQQATEKALKGDRDLSLAERRRDEARAAFDEACIQNERIRQAIDDADPIKRAMKEGRVVPGMTLTEVERSLRSKGRLVSETESSTFYRFVESQRNFKTPKPPFVSGQVVSAPTREVHVTFSGDKATFITYGSWRVDQVR
jgi:hypothetical protein